MSSSCAYNLNVQIAASDLLTLKASSYRMYIAKRVNGDYNVGWVGQDLEDDNDFTWMNRYRIFTCDEYTIGETVLVPSSAVDIAPGQAVVIDSFGIISTAQGLPKRQGAVYVENDWGRATRIGLACCLNGQYRPIYVTPKPVKSGIVEINPEEAILVWFDKAIEAPGTVESIPDTLSVPSSKQIEVVFNSTTCSRVISYYTAAHSASGEGRWVKNSLPTMEAE